MKNEMFRFLGSKDMKLGLQSHYLVSIPLLKLALDYKVDINNFIDSEETTPLMQTLDSLASDNIPTIEFLLANGADPNHFKKTKLRYWLRENPLVQALYTHNIYRLRIVQLLLNYGARINWKSHEGFMTALTPFFSALPTHRDRTENLSILVTLLKSGAGSLPALFVEYEKFVSDKAKMGVYQRYIYLALLGYFFLSKIQQIRFNPVSEILQNHFPSVLATVICYYIDYHNEGFNNAVERLSYCVETNYSDDLACQDLDKKPIAWPYPNYPLSLAAYTDFFAMQPLIDAKADVTFIDDNSGFTPLDYAVKRNPDMERDNIGDSYSYTPKSENRFNRVKIITDALKDCYRQTLLYEAQRVSEVLKAKSASAITQKGQADRGNHDSLFIPSK